MLYYDILYFLILTRNINCFNIRNINCFNIYIFILFKFTKSIKKKYEIIIIIVFIKII